jgi:hypothetical protein
MRGTFASSAETVLPQFNNHGENSYKTRKYPLRKTFTKTGISQYRSLRAQQRRLVHRLQRNPKIAVLAFTMAALFALGLLICLGLATSAYTIELDEKTIPKPDAIFEVESAAGIIFRDQEKIIPEQITLSDLKQAAASMTHVSLPTGSIEDTNTPEIPDYGGLEMMFFKEDGAEREIRRDDLFDLTEFREFKPFFHDDVIG